MTAPRPLLLLVALAAALLSVGATAGDAFAKAREDTPEALYEKAEKQMRRGYYEEAIATFDQVRNHFPMNPYSVKAELRVADCLFAKGEYLSAVDAYRNFEKLHPTHAELDYVVFRIAAAHFKGSHRTAQRDQTSTELAVRTLQGYESRFPEGRHLAEVAKMRETARGRLAKGVSAVGDYYYWRARLLRAEAKSTAFNAAARRYRALVEEFPDVPLAERGRYRLGMALLHLGDVDGARRAFADLRPGADGKPTRWMRKAEDALRDPPKAVPPPAEGAGPIVRQSRN
ncbi:outer membrane protein assembly factor BamD [Myxococcota bacterium]|nr:outer membrane protein assembly factor BamD [Myxococcota bacterium]